MFATKILRSKIPVSEPFSDSAQVRDSRLITSERMCFATDNVILYITMSKAKS